MRVQYMNDAVAFLNDQVVDQFPFMRDRLGADGGGGLDQLVGLDFRHQPLERFHKSVSVVGAPHLGQTRGPLIGQQPPETGEGENFPQVFGIDDVAGVALAREGQDGVGTAFHGAVNAFDKVRSQRGDVGDRYRINDSVAEG